MTIGYPRDHQLLSVLFRVFYYTFPFIISSYKLKLEEAICETCYALYVKYI